MFLSLIMGVCSMAGCSKLTFAPTPTAMAINTTIPTKTPLPPATLLPKPTLLPAISPSNEIISSQNIGRLKQLDARELASKPEDFAPRRMDFTPDGHMIAADSDTRVYVWDGTTGQQIAVFDHFYYLWHTAISPNGKFVAAGGDAGGLKIWDVQTGEKIYTFSHAGTIWSLAFSPDSSTLASGTLDSSVKIWNLIDGQELDHLTDIALQSLAFSPDGKILAIGTDYKIILWDVASKQLIKTLVFDLRGGEGLSGIQGILFSPDGHMIAAANGDNIAMVWEISSGKKLSTINGRYTIIRENKGALAFSPDSKIIVVGNDDGDIIFWDVFANQELRTMTSPNCLPLDLAFWPDGNILEVGCWNGTIQFWGVP